MVFRGTDQIGNVGSFLRQAFLPAQGQIGGKTPCLLRRMAQVETERGMLLAGIVLQDLYLNSKIGCALLEPNPPR